MSNARVWKASKYDDPAGERVSRMIPVHIHSEDATELRTLGDVVDYLNKQEARMSAMRVVIEANAR